MRTTSDTPNGRPATSRLLVILTCSRGLIVVIHKRQARKVQRVQIADVYSLVGVPQLGKGLVSKVALWDAHGWVHRDLSVSNVGLADDGNVIIWDFPTMVNVPESMEQHRRTGTWLYMAISVQQSAAPTLSSELESIFYILTGLSSKDGVVHWQKSCLGDSDAKVAGMMDGHTFEAKVKAQTYLHSVTCMMKSQPKPPISCQRSFSV